MTKPTPRAFGLALAACLLAALALAVPASSEKASLNTTLSGNAEVPKEADPDGKGTATIKTDDEKNTVCFKLSFKGIDEPIAAHIHKAPKGKTQELPAVRLSDKVPLTQSGCVKKVSASLVRQISTKPAGFYVNIHTNAFPDGAVRGQLSGKSS